MPRSSRSADDRRPGRARSERASGLLGTVIGVGVVVALIGLGANVSLGLWTRSTVDAVAYDAARDVATAPHGADLRVEAADALARASSALGPLSTRVSMRFERLDADLVELRVTAPGVPLLPRLIGTGPVVRGLDRRLVLRRETR